MVYGEYKLLYPLDTEIYAYTRTCEEDKLLVILNFFDQQPIFEWPEDLRPDGARLLISNYKPVPEENVQKLQLRPYEARVYLLS
ncbi:Oligo-1,6-glucosidase [compost metagenome]